MRPGKLTRWLDTKDQLNRDAHGLGLPNHRFYLAPRSGLTAGQYLLARDIGAAPIVGSVHIDPNTHRTVRTFRQGDIVVLTLGQQPESAANALDQLLRGLGPPRPNRRFLRRARRFEAMTPVGRGETGARSRPLLLPGVAVCAYWLPGAAAVCPPLRLALGVRNRLDADERALLTFDDGPHAQGTPAVLELLREAAVRATFFLVGEQVERRPQLAAEIAAAGHEVALHCHRHRCLLRLTPRQVRDDLRRAQAMIADATGQLPRRYRPPYGIFNAAALALARARGWEPLLWSRDGRDWQRGATPNSIAARATRGLRGGEVILLHDADHYSAPDSWRQTVAALPRILEAIER